MVRGRDAQPHPFQGIPALHLDQERDQDHHDDPGLQAFPQADQAATEKLR